MKINTDFYYRQKQQLHESVRFNYHLNYNDNLRVEYFRIIKKVVPEFIKRER